MVKEARQPGLDKDTRAKRHITQRTHGVYEHSQVSTKWLLMTVIHTQTRIHTLRRTHTRSSTLHMRRRLTYKRHITNTKTHTHIHRHRHITHTNTHTQSSLTAETATATDCKTHTGHHVESLGQYNQFLICELRACTSRGAVKITRVDSGCSRTSKEWTLVQLVGKGSKLIGSR